MSEIRTDPLSGHRVIVATNRLKRPHEFHRYSQRRSDAVCPFCVGNEAKTPPEIAAYRQWRPEPDADDWQLRVVPNLYPAIGQEEATASTPDDSDLFPVQTGKGTHELVIESPQHVRSFSELSTTQAHRTLVAFRDRLLVHTRSNHRYTQVFKNVGPEAGASIDHTHSQLLALPDLPPKVQRLVQNCRTYHGNHGKCLVCALTEREMQSNRQILHTDNFAAYCPFAGCFPYGFRIVPRIHQSRFQDVPFPQLGELAQLLRDLLIALESTIENPAYNLLIQNSPFDTDREEYYHWHVEVFPRLTNLAGFECATGCYINPVSPDKAASDLRELVRSDLCGR